ncbi:MAG: hypothetical protein IJ092_11060, partial [Atopobiaceae bacterium]|nr:hypothetical protein [Atopobiaceae bacterium]
MAAPFDGSIIVANDFIVNTLVSLLLDFLLGALTVGNLKRTTYWPGTPIERGARLIGQMPGNEADTAHDRERGHLNNGPIY